MMFLKSSFLSGIAQVIMMYVGGCATGKILSSFSENGREGHVSYTEAYQRVLRVSEEKIMDDFAVKFNKFIDTFAGI